MVYVMLQSDWTDGSGVSHLAGDSVDVDAATLAALQAQGIVSEQSGGGKDGTEWVGPGSTNWVGPGSNTP
ncbi:hypothetical protein OG777_16740 [Micromonospora peucetia]|jgi:hypothetical protein|uniref:Uncharacterized protein n=2 Tax=Micromonospora TaxID=1873 RepID=A0A1C6VPM0_9ACTN|nr:MULTISPECIES: hypothetical protein [Micromonospora]KAB1154478.1 hypothetical protein F6X68_13125 [Micromonospora sp. AMSO12t]MCX4388570.1 hypothetical protein [Micromonospora peucetia]MDT0529426.1 hypothetical protein [Micromonospora sp. DSM 115977]WSA30774.1 hypothetical protein OIE14_21730 [Micromonospora peucetia]WSG01807.1 hypothetical protein OG989_29860 [Micromonospora sp. NBC_01740]